MKPVPAHQLLSAYLDGELSSAEREDVERLLESSADARQELAELDQIGELLRQLPRESLPESFTAHIQRVCESETILPAQTPTPETGIPIINAAPAGLEKRSRRQPWRSFVGVGLTAAVLGGIAIYFAPKPNPQNPAEVVQQNTNPLSNLRLPEEAERFGTLPLAAPETGQNRNEAPLPQDRQAMPATTAEEAESQAAFGAASVEALPSVAPQLSEADASGFPNKSLQDKNAQQMLEDLANQTEHVVVVRLKVADREKSLEQLQGLLQRHNIVRSQSVRFNRNRDLKKAEDGELPAVFVEAQDNQWTAALQSLEADKTFAEVQVESPVSVATLDFYFPDGPQRFSNSRGNAFRQFGGGGFRSSPPQPAAADAFEKIEAASEPLPKAEAPKDAAKPKIAPGEKKPLANRSARAMTAPNAPGATTPIEAASPFGGQGLGGGLQPSMQRETSISAEQWEKLRQQLTTTPPADPQATKPQPEEKKSPITQRVRVLFVLEAQK